MLRHRLFMPLLPFVAFRPDEPDAGGAPTYTPPATQAELDRIIQARLDRDRRSRPDDAEIARLRERAGIADTLEAEKRTAAEQAQHDATEAERLANERKTAAEQILATANARLIDAAIQVAATAAGSVAPAAVAKFIADGTVTIDDAGTVTGAEEAVKAALEANPFLATSSPGTEGTPPAPGSAVTVDSGPRSTAPKLTPAQVKELAESNPDEFNRQIDAGELSLSDLAPG